MGFDGHSDKVSSKGSGIFDSVQSCLMLSHQDLPIQPRHDGGSCVFPWHLQERLRQMHKLWILFLISSALAISFILSVFSFHS